MSWPVKKGMGVQLGYGVEGSVIYKSTSTKDKLQFAKERDPIVTLHKIQDGFKELIPPEAEMKKTSFDVNSNRLDIPLLPAHLRKELEFESEAFLSDMIYDPTVKQLMAVAKIKLGMRDSFMKVIAVAGGAGGASLSLSVIDLSATSNVAGLKFNVSFSFPFIIKQITFCNLSSTLGNIAAPYFLVRSETIIHVLKLRAIKGVQYAHKEAQLAIELIDELDFDYKIADMSFNPFDYCQFSVVSAKGECSVWNISPRSDIQSLKKILTVSIRNPSEFSGFKKAEWMGNYRSLLMADRTSICCFDLQTEERKTLVVAGSFSNIRDLARINDDHSVLLTSKEIILVSITGNTFERLVSWKHFLDDSDTTMHLAPSDFTRVNNGNTLYYCSVFSSCNTLVMNVQFGIKEGFWRCMGNPSVHIVGASGSPKDVAFIPFILSDLSIYGDSALCITEENVSSIGEEVHFLMFVFWNDFKLTVDRFSSKPQTHKSLPNPSLTLSSSDSLDGITAILDLCNRLPVRDEDNRGESSQSDQLDRLSHSLGSQLTAFLESESRNAGNLWVSLDSISGISDIDELDSMIEQLFAYFTDRGLIFSLNCCQIPNEARSSTTPIRALLDWLVDHRMGTESDLKQLAIQIVFSAITFKCSNVTVKSKSAEDELLADFPNDVQKILSNWDTAGLVEEEKESQHRKLKPVSSMIPSIRVSQPATQVTNAQSQKEVGLPAEPQSQEGSQAFNALTQIERGVFGGRAAKKKKKKKLSGFA